MSVVFRCRVAEARVIGDTRVGRTRVGRTRVNRRHASNHDPAERTLVATTTDGAAALNGYVTRVAGRVGVAGNARIN